MADDKSIIAFPATRLGAVDSSMLKGGESRKIGFTWFRIRKNWTRTSATMKHCREILYLFKMQELPHAFVGVLADELMNSM